MTNTFAVDPLPVSPPSPPRGADPRLGGADPRLGLATALARGGSAIANVTPGQLGGPTPCTDLAVRDLLGHMVSVLHLLAAVGRGEDALRVPETSGVADTAWVHAWMEAAHEVQAAWTDPDVLERTMILPFGQLPGAAVLAVYTGQVTIHTWDLATATGQRPEWDNGIVAATLMASERVLPPTRSPGIPVGPQVAIGRDRPLIERLVAWTGR
jgi:uncharacterized protein (TIGR03086 family)